MLPHLAQEDLERAKITMQFIGLTSIHITASDIPEAKQLPPQAYAEFGMFYQMAIARKLAKLTMINCFYNLLSVEYAAKNGGIAKDPKDLAIAERFDQVMGLLPRYLAASTKKLPHGIERHLQIALPAEDVRALMVRITSLDIIAMRELVEKEIETCQTFIRELKECDKLKAQSIIRDANSIDTLIATISLDESPESHQKVIQFLSLLDKIDVAQQLTVFSLLLGRLSTQGVAIDGIREYLTNFILMSESELQHQEQLMNALYQAEPHEPQAPQSASAAAATPQSRSIAEAVRMTLLGGTRQSRATLSDSEAVEVELTLGDALRHLQPS